MTRSAQKVKLPTEAASIKGMKIAYSVDLGYVPVEPAVRKNMLEAIEVFRKLGAKVEEVDLGWTADVEKNGLHWYNLMHFGRQTIWHLKDSAAPDDRLRDQVRRGGAEADGAGRRAQAVGSRRTACTRRWGRCWPPTTCSSAPPTMRPAVRADHDPWDETFTVNGQKADPEFGWVMTHQFNMLHNCPVLSVPSGHAADQGADRHPAGRPHLGRCEGVPRRAGLREGGGRLVRHEESPAARCDFP